MAAWRQIVPACIALLGACCRAADGTSVNEEDVKALVPQTNSGQDIQPWRDGVVICTADHRWLTASWNRPKAELMNSQTGVTVLDVCRNRSGYFIHLRDGGEIKVLHWKKDAWELVKLPETLPDVSAVRLIPCDPGIALGLGNTVWWMKDGLWKTTTVTPCPSMLRGNGHSMDVDPLGDVRFIKHGFLYAGSNGGEFGSAFATYELSHDSGSWNLIWRGPSVFSVQRLFEDSSGDLYAFTRYHYRGPYQYRLLRGVVTRWETLIENSLPAVELPETRNHPAHDVLQKDSFVADAAPMPDGRIALFADGEGIYVKGHDDCPSLLRFDFKLERSFGSQCFCFDDAGNAYVTTPSLGLLAFHKENKGSWRVKQIQVPP